MSVTNSPNMGLTIPGVGSERGPDYAVEVNTSLTLIDTHDHTPGRGVPITPAGININTTLPLNDNFITTAAGIGLTTQAVTPGVSTIYQSGDDLFFVDALGNNIAITANGGIAGSPGSIANLVAPASASYVSGSSTFVWQSNTGIAANMDAGTLLLRNLTPNSTFAISLQPPAGLSSNYDIVLPSLPVATSFMAITSSGVTSATVPVSLGITASNLAADSVITSKILDQNVTNAKIADDGISTIKILDNNVTRAKLAFDTFYNIVTDVYQGSATWVVPLGVSGAVITVVGAGGGGGGGASGGTGGGAGGAGGAVVVANVALTQGETITITQGAGGAGGAASVGGGNGGLSIVQGGFGIVQAAGGLGGLASTAATGGSAGATIRGAWITTPGGRGSDGGVANGEAGSPGPRGASGGAQGGGAGCGGGGGAGVDLGGTLGTGGAGGASGVGGNGPPNANNGAGGGGGGANAAGALGRNGVIIISYTRGVV